MNEGYSYHTGLAASDVAAIRKMYGRRAPDAYDAVASNETLGTATSMPVVPGGLNQFAAVGDVNAESLKAMDELIDEGITSFKLFMAYPGVFLSSDGQIVQAMQTAAEAARSPTVHGQGERLHPEREARLGELGRQVP